MSLFTTIIVLIMTINTILAVITVLRQPRDIAVTWAWLLVLNLLPIIGFILFMFTGRGLSRKKLAKSQSQFDEGLSTLVAIQKKENQNKALLSHKIMSTEASEMVNLFLNTSNAPLLKDNQIELLIDGKEKFQQLFTDIQNATSSIHVEYYTIYNDQLGNQLQELLIDKAKSGVEVRVLYDAWGSGGQSKRWWRQLQQAGGFVSTFFSSKHSIIDFRMNFRDHRKIVVIDGKIGYTGGFNVGDQYLGESEKFGYWRDTHLKMIGNGVLALQARFLMDWNASVSNKLAIHYNEIYFPTEMPEITKQHNNGPAIQFVASGPDHVGEQIKMGYLKMISSAKKRLWIQTPYLVPDDSIIDALKTAALSGVDVRIMTPDKPDHPFIFRATQYYSHLLLESGVKIYQYQNGFMHAKTVLVDDQISSIGSANFDIRSFKLNFEANTFIYDYDLTQKLATVFTNDMAASQLVTQSLIDQQSTWMKFKQKFARLLSPIL